MGNAVKFTEIGEVKIAVRLVDRDTTEPKLRIEVIDMGVGMSPQQLERLFQPFQQADASTTRKFGGTGLGLVISKRLAELLGGNITASSVPGKGSIFTLTIATGPGGRALVDQPARPSHRSPPSRNRPRPLTLGSTAGFSWPRTDRTTNGSSLLSYVRRGPRSRSSKTARWRWRRL